MDEIETGGPAFPCETPLTNEGDVLVNPGMTLRDYFAAKALPAAFKYVALIEDDETGKPYGFHFNADGSNISSDCNMTADCAYEMADAMLIARK